MTPTIQPKRRGRPRKVEPFPDWMARIDAEVDAMAKKIERQPPTYAYLHPDQKRIVKMLIEHMRSLPELQEGQSAFEKREYDCVNGILKELFLAKYPAWRNAPRCRSGAWDVDQIPNGEGRVYARLLRNCAGRAPVEKAAQRNEGDSE